MPVPIIEFKLEDVGGGGANEKVKGDAVNNNQSVPPVKNQLPLKNCHTNEIGSIVKRKGYSVYSGQLEVSGSPTNALEAVTGLFQYKKFNGSEYEIACATDATDQKIYDISSPGSPSDITGGASITNDSKFSFAVLNDILVMSTEDRDTTLKWNGSGNVATLGGSPIDGKYCIEFENYLFIANTSSNPERIYFSGLADPESWTATDFLRLPGPITGIGKSQNELFVFTEQSISVVRFTGDAIAPFNRTPLETNVGCGSHHSIINIEGILYWMGNDGHIYRMRGLQPQRITELIPDTINQVNQGVLSKCVAADHKELRQAWFAVSYGTATTNDFIIAFDYLREEIFFYNGETTSDANDRITVNYLANFIDSNGAVRTYFGDRAGYVYLSNDGLTDNPEEVSQEIEMFRWTKQFNFGSIGLVKRIRKVLSTVNNEGDFNTQITVRGDYGGSSGEVITVSHDGGGDLLGTTFVLGTSKLGGPEDVTSRAFDVCATSKTYQFKFFNNDSGADIEIRDLACFFQTLPGMNR